MSKRIYEIADELISSEMETVKGGSMSGCSSCCDRANGGTNQQPEKQEELENGNGPY